jgi:hypothetical protein
MKKISHYLRIIISLPFKILMGALVGMVLGMGLGKDSIQERKKDKTHIESKK